LLESVDKGHEYNLHLN